MLIITFCALLLASTCSANSITDDQDFRKYVQDIQSQVDETVKSCENFGKYACGKLRSGNNYNMSHLIEQLLEQGLVNYENKKYANDVEKMITTFYLSCKRDSNDSTAVLKQVEVLKSVKSWPVTRDFSDTEIAKLLGYLSTLDYIQVFSIDRTALAKDNTITIKTSANMYTGNMLSILDKFGVSKEESLIIFQNITSFIEKLKKANTAVSSQTVYHELKDVTALKETVPNFDWDTYFTTFTNIFQLDNDNFVKKTVKMPNLEELKKAVEIIKETDSRTVANYLIWRILDMTFDAYCEKIVYLFMHLPHKYLSNNENRAKKYFTNEIEAITHFEKSYLEIKSQLNNQESRNIYPILENKKKGYQNYEKFMSGQYWLELFSGFEINEKTFYSNLIHILQARNKDLINNGNFEIFAEIMWPAIERFVKLENVTNPFLRNFIKTNSNLWIRVIEDIYENRTINDNCFPYENKINNFRNMIYLNYHAAYHLALNEYLNYVNEHTNELKKQTEILTETGLNYVKLYMLTLAQETCTTSGRKDLDDANLLWFFKHSKDFSDNWSCAAGDAMNKICDDSTFVPNFKKST